MHDFAVVGLGAIGSATAAELVRRGHSVLGFDRYRPPHEYGSAHSETRLIREAAYQGSRYMPLLGDAYRRWKRLERSSGRKLLRTSGALLMGPKDGRAMAVSLETAARSSPDYATLGRREVAERFPPLRPSPGTLSIYEPRGGILSLEECLEATLETAAGADLHFDEPVLGWSAAATGVAIRTDRRECRARRLAIVAGAWTAALLPGVALPLAVDRTVQYWFEPAEGGFEGDFPSWVWEVEPGRVWYGFPPTPGGIKTGMHWDAGRGTDVDRVDRVVHASEKLAMRSLFERHAPGATRRLNHSSVCLYTNTPDHDFILDRHPDHEDIVVFAGGSGHAFKFAPALGSLMADLLEDSPPKHDLRHFSIGRFGLP